MSVSASKAGVGHLYHAEIAVRERGVVDVEDGR